MGSERVLRKFWVDFVDCLEDGPAKFHPAFEAGLLVHEPRRSVWCEVTGGVGSQCKTIPANAQVTVGRRVE